MTAPIKVTDGLYQVESFVNIFILETGPDELTIIDAGAPGSSKRVFSAIYALGHTPQMVKHILITHADIDHIGSLAGLASASGAAIYAGIESKAHIEARTSPEHLPAIASVIINPLMKLFVKPARVTQVISDGEQLDIGGGITAYHTPGHTPDNYNFYWHAKDALFTADLLNTRFGARLGELKISPPRISWDMAAVKQNALKMLDLKPAIICVGHGPSLTGDDVTKQSAQLRLSLT